MENSSNIFFFYPEVKANEKTRKVIAGIYDPKTNIIKIGKSECSIKDKFNKIKGRSIALGRAKCDRPFKEKQFIQKGEIIKTNKDLIPILIEVKGINPLHQFLEIAKIM